MVSLQSRLALSFVGLLLIGFLSGCDPSRNSPVNSTFVVNSTFIDFYREIGGLNTLGPAISSGFTKDGITYQYVVSGLMVYDPNQIALKRFYFSPLASAEWRISGIAEPAPADANTTYTNGHQIWEEVISFYNQYSPEIIGLPVTGVMANDAKQRYEQYFEGLGFYRNYTNPPGQIHLMPYGVWMCGSTCLYHITDSTPPSSSYARNYTETEQLFIQVSERLGYGYTGAPLATPHLGSDGFYEMTFENVILFIDPASPDQVKLRPLPEWLGIQSEKPVSERKADWLSFYTVEAGLGFNVPNSFISYINDHGGTKYSGAPIAEFHPLADGGYSQCFTNLCLEYHPNAPQTLRVRPHPLGTEYLSLGENVTASGSSLPDALQINAWEDLPLIPSGQSQGINIEAIKNKNPVSGIKFSLMVTQPNGITKTYTLDPTGEDGKTHIDLDPINGPNGAIVQYEICVLGDDAPQICFSRSYTIWEQ
ncbi:MAG TPA: hypothetical protein VLD65_02610 [Anaerolineales bacterium]|nr:hypothetical protein [Anaerolineales bacterium]